MHTRRKATDKAPNYRLVYKKKTKNNENKRIESG